MLNAVFKLVFISLSVVILLFFAGLGIRATGSNRVYSTPPHIWFEHARWSIAVPEPDALCASPPSSRADVILIAPVRKSPAAWELACASHVPLAEFLARTTHLDWLLDVESGVAEDLDKFVDIVNNFKGGRIGIHARSQRAARHLRKTSPKWVFAADDASILRLHLFASFFIEPALEFWPDFVLVREADEFNAREAAELRRRRKRIVWLSNETPPFEVDGTFASSTR